jgi:hypothetical protein
MLGNNPNIESLEFSDLIWVSLSNKYRTTTLKK